MAAETRPAPLTAAQLSALFDILNHEATYREVEAFKHPDVIARFGYPFATALPADGAPNHAPESSSPLLQLVMAKLVLTSPGMSDLPPDFWTSNTQANLMKLAGANLSESYDKGTLGTRKTLAAGGSVLHEAFTRGLLGGVPKRDTIDLKKAKYDTTQATDLERAYDDFMQELVHGNLADDLFDHFAATPDIDAHSVAVSAAVDYSILHIAAAMHHVLVCSREGQYLLKLLESVYSLIPFTMVRQTLRIGNAATMMNAMLRVFLAKTGMGAVTNWFGLTRDADDGMNLLQRIIALVLSWDASEFRKQATAAESAKDRPTKLQLAALKAYTTMPGSQQDALRERSTAEAKSMVAVILDDSDPTLTASLSPAQHAHCARWLSATLSTRDRDEITRALCRSQPDTFTAAVRGSVGAFEPMIRTLHENMDLREPVTSIETFVAELIEASKPKKRGGGERRRNWRGVKKDEEVVARPPSVEDYVALLRRNKHLLFQFLHQFARNCTDLRAVFQTWLKDVVCEFRQRDDGGGISAKLQALYAHLPAPQQVTIRADLDAHAAYLGQLDALSKERTQHVLDQLGHEPPSPSSESASETKSDLSSRSASKSPSPRVSSGSGPSMSGPGAWLMRWDALLDTSPVTPATAEGEVRWGRGRDVKGCMAVEKTGAAEVGKSGADAGWDVDAMMREKEKGVPRPPEVGAVMQALGEGFRRMVIVDAGKCGQEEKVPGQEMDVAMREEAKRVGQEVVVAA